MKIVSLFSGIGAFEKGLTNLGIEHEVVGFSEIDKYAMTSYCAIHGVDKELNMGDITTINHADVPDCDLVTHGSPCFTGDTLVLTSDGYKQIKDVKIGDKVLSHDKQYHEVVDFLEQGEKEIWTIKAMGIDLLETTSNHKFYTREMYREWDNFKRSYNRLFKDPKWVECKDLTKSNYLGMSINKNSKLPKWGGVECTRGKSTYIKNNLPLEDERFWYLCGRFLGDGWVRVRHDRNSNISGAIICCGKHKIGKFKEKIGDLFNYTLVEERTTFKLQFPNKELGTFLSQFGNGASNKTVPGFAIDLPVNLLSSFLEGYWDSDGSYSNGLYSATSTSRELVYGIGHCIAKVYKRPYRIYKFNRPDTCVIEGRVVNQRDTYQIEFKKDDGIQDQAFYEDGYIWYPIRDVVNTNVLKDTYDITVDKSHSFIANGAIAHNCQDYSFSGKGKGGDEGSGTRSSLMWHTVDIVAHKKPKYVIWENVKGVLSKNHRHNFERYLTDLEDLGYNNHYKVLNSKEFGIPQNRDRIYVISIRKDVDDGLFTFPTPFDSGLRLKDLLEKEVEEKYYIDNEKTRKLLETLKGRDLLPGGVNVSRKGEVFDNNTEVASCLLARDYKGLGNQSMTAVAEPIIVASRGRNPENPSDRTVGSPTEQRLEPNSQGICNCITSVQKDCLVLEPVMLRNERTEYGKEVRKAYESGELEEKIGNMHELSPRPDGFSNTVTTVQKDCLILEPKRLGGLYDKEGSRHQAGSVWDKETIAPTIDTMQGGNRTPLVVEEGYVERKYKEFIEERGYMPEAFNPYNCQEVTDIAPTVTTQCGSTTSSSTVLLKEENKLKFVGGIGDRDWVGDDKELSRNYPQGNRVYDSEGIACSQTANGGGIGGPTGLYEVDFRIRKLTPKECFRLMAFSDEDYEKARLALMEEHYNGKDRTNSQMYKIAGNSITVNVLEEIYKNLFSDLIPTLGGEN